MLETPKALDTFMVKTLMDSTMDNQQAREVAYIAGLIDGEGSLCMERSVSNGRNIRYTPRFSFGITNQAVAEKLKFFLEKHEIGYYQSKRLYKEPYLPVYSFEVKRMTQLYKFLKLVSLELVGKRRQADLLIRFIESRLDEHGDIKYRGNSKGGFSYEPWVADVWLELRTLNGRNKPKGDDTQLASLHDQMSSCTVLYGTKAMVSPVDESNSTVTPVVAS